MANIKTSNPNNNKTNQSLTEIKGNIKQINTNITKIVDVIAKKNEKTTNLLVNNQNRQRGASSSQNKTQEDREKQLAKLLKQLDARYEEQKWQNNLNLAKNATNAVLPKERRQTFGAAGIGTAFGMDAAVVQMLGIDKLGAALWNRFFGWDAINQRHKKKEDYKNAYGSVLKGDSEETKQLKEINRTLKGDKKSQEKKEEEKEKGGLLSKILQFLAGPALKVLMGALGATLLLGLKPFIKDALSNFLGGFLGEDIGGFLGSAITDIIPGAILGFSIGGLKGALIGGAVTFVWPRLKALVNDVVGMFTGADPQASPTDSIMAGVMTGAASGAFITGKFSLRNMLTGAVIGGAGALLLSVITQGKQMLQNAASGEKPLETISSMAMAGATMGAFSKGTKLSLKGLITGALIGGSIGLVTAMIADTRNIIMGKGEGNPESAFGSIGKTVATAIAGACIGYKYGGIKGAILGGLIGGGIGILWTAVDRISSYINGGSEEKQEKGASEIDKITTKGPSSEAINATDYAVNRKRELEEKKKAGTLTEEEEKELGTIEKGLYRANKRAADAANADTNKDGFISPEELKAFDKKNGRGVGGTARSVRQMREVMERSGGKGFTIKDLTDYQLEKYDDSLKVEPKNTPLSTENMPTLAQLENAKQAENLTDSNNRLITSMETLTKIINDKPMDNMTVISENNQSNIDVYGSGMNGLPMQH